MAGLLLCAVRSGEETTSVDVTSYKQGMGLLKAASRPVTLSFEAQEPVLTAATIPMVVELMAAGAAEPVSQAAAVEAAESALVPGDLEALASALNELVQEDTANGIEALASALGKPTPEDTAGGADVPIEVALEQHGALGIGFALRTVNGCERVRIQHVVEGSQAAGHKALVVGLLLRTVRSASHGAEPVLVTSYKQAMGLIKAASRPIFLLFETAEINEPAASLEQAGSQENVSPWAITPAHQKNDAIDDESLQSQQHGTLESGEGGLVFQSVAPSDADQALEVETYLKARRLEERAEDVISSFKKHAVPPSEWLETLECMPEEDLAMYTMSVMMAKTSGDGSGISVRKQPLSPRDVPAEPELVATFSLDASEGSDSASSVESSSEESEEEEEVTDTKEDEPVASLPSDSAEKPHPSTKVHQPKLSVLRRHSVSMGNASFSQLVVSTDSEVESDDDSGTVTVLGQYQVLSKVMCRAGPTLDSKEAAWLQPGDVVVALEEHLLPNGTTRLRVGAPQGCWVSSKPHLLKQLDADVSATIPVHGTGGDPATDEKMAARIKVAAEQVEEWKKMALNALNEHEAETQVHDIVAGAAGGLLESILRSQIEALTTQVAFGDEVAEQWKHEVHLSQLHISSLEERCQHAEEAERVAHDLAEQMVLTAEGSVEEAEAKIQEYNERFAAESVQFAEKHASDIGAQMVQLHIDNAEAHLAAEARLAAAHSEKQQMVNAHREEVAALATEQQRLRYNHEVELASLRSSNVAAAEAEAHR